ncbi:MAG: DNRLRE domain-containing protein, partial [Phycisphaerales bacterium]|nr:DNRLRE domain-containing protein [Phycisphaerales bacterium]
TPPGSGFRLVRMTADWAEDTATWNSLINGVELGIDTLATIDAIVGAPGTTEPVNGVVSVDVTAALRAWQLDPTSNFGWVLLPIEGGFNGTRFWSSEAALEANRPQLRVEIPTPGVASALALAGITTLRRRRR